MTFTPERRLLLAGALCAGASITVPSWAGTTRKAFFERIRRPIGLQLYTLGDAPQKDLEGTLKQVAAIGYREIELPGLLGHSPTDIRRAADSADLIIGSVHIGTLGTLSIQSDAQRIADVMAELGTTQLVVPMFAMPAGFKALPGEAYTAAIARAAQAAGEDHWKNLARLLNDRAAVLKPHGISVSYHNHNVEFMPIGSRTGWQILTAETQPDLVHFEVDIGWVVSAGQDPVAFFKRYAGRVRQVHVKDVKSGFQPNTALATDPAEVGSGGIDWARVLPAAYAAGARDFYVEQEPPFSIPRLDAAAKSYAYLARLRA